MKRIVLNKKFQREIFETLLRKFSMRDLTEVLGVNSASIYHIKNGKIGSIDLVGFRKIAKMLELPDEVVKKNTIKIISSDELLKGLEIGRKVRSDQLKKWKNEVPKLNEIIENNSLNVELWFEKYVKLTDFGARKIIKTTKTGDKIVIYMETHSNVTKSKKLYKIILPKRINLDNDFIYFLGLWCGDRAGGGRVGILNIRSELILFAAKYLRKLYQKPHFVILKSTNFRGNVLKLPFKIDKIQPVKNMTGTYVPMVFSVNGYLKSFFDYLDENLDELLYKLPNKEVFFAGLFDAEGNVVLEDRYFRWACKDPKKVEIYKKHLALLDLFKRYDGINLVTDSRENFLKYIFPYIKNNAKINRINLLFFNKGRLENRFKKILLAIKDRPDKTASELNTLFDRKKIWPQLKFLCDTGYLKREGYPMKFCITEKGLKEVVM